jgi:hypothetical protein
MTTDMIECGGLLVEATLLTGSAIATKRTTKRAGIALSYATLISRNRRGRFDRR